MDGTIVELPGFRGKGEYKAKTLAQSPCQEPLERWLRLGGKVLIVTSDDGNAPVRKVWECIPAELRANRQVMLSTSDGAALWYDEDGHITADTDYTKSASANGSTGLPDEHMDDLLAIARDMHIQFFSDLLAERASAEQDTLRLLTPMHQKAYTKVLDRVLAGETTIEQALSLDNLLHFSRITRGSMLWRNQPGPTESWAGFQQHDPKDQKARRKAFAGLCATHPEAVYTNLFVMGMPRSVSAKYIEQAAPKLALLGLSVSAAPNTVCIKNAAVNKALPIQYLQETGELHLSKSYAFGDNPAGNDGPLTTFPEMQFFSVAKTIEETPEACQTNHIGGLEFGTSVVLEKLCDMLELGKSLPSPEENFIVQCRAETVDKYAACSSSSL